MESLEQVERCPECRGHVVRSGDEYVCTSCGRVAGKAEEERYRPGLHVKAPSHLSDAGLGSYMGERSDTDSRADFNGVSTLGFAKLLSDNLGDETGRKCEAMIRRAADRLSLPAFVRDNAEATSRRVLAEWRRKGEPGGRHRTTAPVISAYALLSACRAAGVGRVSARTVLRTYTDMGYRVSMSGLLSLGIESGVPLSPPDPAALLREVVAGLEAKDGVAGKLKRGGFEPGQYFRSLFRASQDIVSAVRCDGEGRSPRTLAAGSVYIASRRMGPRAFTAKDVAETLGVAEYTVREFVAQVGRGLSPPLKAGPS
jgi:transcription initiation factor TFIIIB Brf1 subunit/transcription initiation factor TFIIB